MNGQGHFGERAPLSRHRIALSPDRCRSARARAGRCWSRPSEWEARALSELEAYFALRVDYAAPLAA